MYHTIYHKLLNLSRDVNISTIIKDENKTLSLLWHSKREILRHREDLLCLKSNASSIWFDYYDWNIPDYIKGVIIDKKRERVIAASFPETEEVLPCDIPQLFGDIIPKNVSLSFAPEGQIVRIFYSEDYGWMFSSNKKLDARDSYWAGPTMKETWDCLWGNYNFDKFMERDSCYIFCMSTKANRILCNNQDELILVAQLKRDGSSMRFEKNPLLRKHHPNVKRTKLIFYRPQRTPKELLSLMNKSFNSLRYTGVLAFFNKGADFKKVKCVKILNPKYNTLIGVRGTGSYFPIEYIKILSTPRYNYKLVEELANLFTEFTPILSKIYDLLPLFVEYIKYLFYSTHYSLHSGYKKRLLIRIINDMRDFPIVKGGKQNIFYRNIEYSIYSGIRNLPYHELSDLYHDLMKTPILKETVVY